MIISLSSGSFATHNRAGEISFVQKGPLTFEATITLYTKTSSVAADRDSVEIFWGDGSSQFLHRSNGWGYPQPNDVKISYYVGTHTYPARGTYTMSMLDPNRIAGILNVNFPDSESVPFYLETTFTILNSQFQGQNNSAVLLQAPIDIACVKQLFRHNPNVFDPDGDSIGYELIIPLQAKNTIVPDYKYPQSIGSGPNNVFSFNEKTGDLIWNTPQIAGEYNVAFRVKEYRNGVLITSIIRDMQILVMNNCKSVPPELAVEDRRCMIAGDTLIADISATDKDLGQMVLINGSGAPFTSEYGFAYISDENKYEKSPVNRKFVWQTTCNHVAKTDYQVLFKAMDNSLTDTSGLTDLKIMKIKVSGPPPQNLVSEVLNSQIRLKWEYPYKCSQTDDNFFKGFSVWRKENSENFEVDTCISGLEGKGYSKIEFITKENDGVNYIYTDISAGKGKLYCYRVLAEFSYNTNDGFPYNPISSIASNETCQFIPDNSPYISKASVVETSESEGKIEIHWLKPNLMVFDTLKYPGPYSMSLFRSNFSNSQQFSELGGAELQFTNFEGQDTFKFTDSGLNTKAGMYFYKAILTDKNMQKFESQPASSPFIKSESLNSSIKLFCDVAVPWIIDSYNLYKYNNITGQFLLISSQTINTLVDSDVIKGQEYCYKVLTIGHLPNETYKLYNFSQIVCAVPEDKQAPCAPQLSANNNCDTEYDFIPQDDLFTYLKWSNPGLTCENSDDVQYFNIYYSKSKDSTFSLLFKILDADKTDTVHLSLDFAGCYYMTAVDSTGNESAPGNIVCVEKCPAYILPNTFTPNDDQQNDLFKPIYKRHIDKIELKIYNSWGVLVFETSDPAINWDGTDRNGKKLNSGSYYYICQPFSVDMKLPLQSGFIAILY